MTNEVSNNPQIPVSADSTSKETTRRQKTILIVIIALAVLFLAGIIVAVWALLQPGTPTERIRDIFIILMAFESLVIGAALIILIVQVASLINLLQNEVRPILEATNETVHTLRGTTAFLSENVVAPVIKLNGYMAGLQRMLELIGMKRK
jgi:ABC-type dipeptide/oligopeptide/nickel transport system permease component